MQVQHMMVRYDYTSRTARLRNRIAIPYHPNSKHESLPSGCLSGLCFFFKQQSPQGYSCDLKDSCSFKTYPSVFDSKFKH